MRIGQLRERITILHKTTTADAQGGRATVWGTFAVVWASVVPLTIQERLRAETIGSQVRYTVTVRYRADITPSMRVRWLPHLATDAKTLEIHGVFNEAADRQRLVLECGEVV